MRSKSFQAEEAFGEKVIEWDHRLYVQRSELCDKLDRLRTMTDILTYPRASKAYDQEQIDNYDDLPLTRTLTNVENSDEQLREVCCLIIFIFLCLLFIFCSNLKQRERVVMKL